jgi:arylsulfatase A-like enzyme
LWLDDTHTPWVPSEEAQNRTPRRDNALPNLRPVLTEMDKQIGRLLAGLREAGVASNTLVLFLGDNGPLPTFNQDRTGGLRGSKLSLYEGGVRVPLIAWWPGRVPLGRMDTESVVSAVDFFPTLVNLAGAKLPPNYMSDGEEFSVPLLLGKSLSRSKPLFWEYGRNTNSFAFPGIQSNRSPTMAVRDGKWKLLVNADGTAAELYDVVSDSNETKNLTSSQSAIAERLTRSALEWRKSLP